MELAQRLHHEDCKCEETDEVEKAQRTPSAILAALHPHSAFDLVFLIGVVEARFVIKPSWFAAS